MGLENSNNNARYSGNSGIETALADAINDNDPTNGEGNGAVEDGRLDSFVLVEEMPAQQSLKNEPPQEEKTAKMAMDVDSQLKRDIEMLSQAIVQYGTSEPDKIKAHTLLKSVLLLYFGDMLYRNEKDKQFHSLKELNDHSGLENFPIASILLHGSRALIEFSPEINHQLIEWLIPDQMSWRYAATHGVETDPPKEKLEHKPAKHLREIKVSPVWEVGRIVYKVLDNAFSFLVLKEATYPEHYGIDIALGGAGNPNFVSQKVIQPNGEHGHLYVNYHAAKEGENGGLLLGIEQSAPGKDDQYGGSHDPGASSKPYSASGGSFFCKKGALKSLPIANYYDSLWNFISNEEFILIQASYNKLIVLVDALFLSAETKADALNLIKEIVSSSGNGNKETFETLFNKYYTKTSWYQSEQEKIQTLSAENNGLRQKITSRQGEQEEQQQRKLQEQEGTLREQEKGMQKLSAENNGLRQKISSHQGEQEEQQRKFQAQAEKLQAQAEKIRKLEEVNRLLRQQLIPNTDENLERETEALSIKPVVTETLALENTASQIEELQALAIRFMHNVKNNMGRFSKNSNKAVIFTQLIDKLEEKNTNELSETDLFWMLRNFIRVAMMNRYDKKGGETHSGKTCLSLLNDPEYKPLKTLLFSQLSQLSQTDDLRYEHLLNGNKKLLASARCQQSLYSAFGLAKTNKNIPNDKLDSAMREFIYKP